MSCEENNVKHSDTLVRSFQLDRILSYDQSGFRLAIHGHIHDKPAILLLERAPFSNSPEHVRQAIEKLNTVKNIGANDVYHWYMANTAYSPFFDDTQVSTSDCSADIKMNLIYPCTEQHFRKYSKQAVRMVTETPQIYRTKILPYISRKIASGTLTWIDNIIEGKSEADNIIYRTPLAQSGDETFILLPDLHWNRSTKENLHLVGFSGRKDIRSIRDLKKSHVSWLRVMRERFLQAAINAYNWLELDQLKIYVHYQPTYYHFHVHIVHVEMEVGLTQAVGKAIGLESIIESLELMDGDKDQGIAQMTLHYTVGEASELWTEVFKPLKEAKKIDANQQP